MEYATHLYPEYGDEELEQLACQFLIKAGELRGMLHPHTLEAMKSRVSHLDAVAAICLNRNRVFASGSPGYYLFPTAEPSKSFLEEDLFMEFQIRSIISDRMTEDGPSFNPVGTEYMSYLADTIMGAEELLAGRIALKSGERGGVNGTENSYATEHLASRYAMVTEGNRPLLRKLIANLSLLPRILNINPFGGHSERMARYSLVAALKYTGLNASGLFSVNRAIARHQREYNDLLDAWELWPAHSGTNLNYEGLSAITKFLMEILLEEMQEMIHFFSTDNINKFIREFVEREGTENQLRPEAELILTELFVKGMVGRQDLLRITGTSDKTLKIITDQLIDRGDVVGRQQGVRLEFTWAG